jgi:hypothetical protein
VAFRSTNFALLRRIEAVNFSSVGFIGFAKLIVVPALAGIAQLDSA